MLTLLRHLSLLTVIFVKENLTNNCPKIILPLLELLQELGKIFPNPNQKMKMTQLELISTKTKPKTNRMTSYFAKNQLIKARFHYEMGPQPLVIYFECQIRMQMNIYESILVPNPPILIDENRKRLIFRPNIALFIPKMSYFGWNWSIVNITILFQKPHKSSHSIFNLSF